MASCITSFWDGGGSTTPRVRLTVTQSSSDNDSVVLAWKFEYIAKYEIRTSITHDCTATINGIKVVNMIHADTWPFEGGYAVDKKTGTHTIASGTMTIDKGHAAKNISFSCSMDFSGILWDKTYWGKNMTASGSISVAAKTSYTVSYNANGGSGAPGSQTKWYGESLTISSVIPKRSGYSFIGWALTKANADAGTWYYKAGSTCGKNENLTLYAVWKADTYSVTYNANGGSGAPAAQTKTHDVNLTLSSTKPTRTNYNFKGWGTSASTTTVSYAAGGTYTANSNITLYAIWELAYKKPRISNLYVNRCLQDGTASDDGTYARVKFDWACDRTVSSITIKWSESSSSSGSTSVDASGTSGSVNTIVGGSLDVEPPYTIQVTVQDAIDYSSASATLNGKKFVIDFLAGGNGVAFGKAATMEGFECAMPAYFTGPVSGVAPANVLLHKPLKTPGWYKLGTLQPSLQYTASATIYIGGQYYYNRPSTAIVDVASTYGLANAKTRLIAYEGLQQITKIGLIMEGYYNCGIYVYYTSSQENNVHIEVDPTYGTFISADLSAVSIDESSLIATAYLNEYDAPPMGLGVEYRTTERWKGKTVYTKLVNLGTLPARNSNIHVSTGVSATAIIRATAQISDGSSMPYGYNRELISFSASTTTINVYTADNEYAVYSDKTGTAQIWYTKD